MEKQFSILLYSNDMKIDRHYWSFRFSGQAQAEAEDFFFLFFLGVLFYYFFSQKLKFA